MLLISTYLNIIMKRSTIKRNSILAIKVAVARCNRLANDKLVPNPIYHSLFRLPSQDFHNTAGISSYTAFR